VKTVALLWSGTKFYRGALPLAEGLLREVAESCDGASRFFVDFLLSRDGQKAVSGGAVAKFPANPDVDSDLKTMDKGHKLHPIDPTMASKFDRLTKNFEEIFCKK
jgi:hypothetical protein